MVYTNHCASPLIIRPRCLQRLCPGSRPPFKLCIVETTTARNRSTHSISFWLVVTSSLLVLCSFDTRFRFGVRPCPGSRPPFKVCIVETATARNRSMHSISVWHQLLITGDLFSFGPLLFWYTIQILCSDFFELAQMIQLAMVYFVCLSDQLKRCNQFCE